VASEPVVFDCGDSQVTNLEVLFTPAEFSALRQRDLSTTDCVVIDVLRATTSMAMALANGALAVIPLEEIAEALAWRRKDENILLAGEREGRRIQAGMSGEISFDLGNSPREFIAESVRGKTIAMTTTNGTRALRACAHARSIFIASFVNLTATAEYLLEHTEQNLLLVCGGTYAEAAYEDVLCAGAIADFVAARDAGGLADSALLARKLYRLEGADLWTALSISRNGRRLLEQADLRDDVKFCAERDRISVVARLERDGFVRRVEEAGN
jgi:2-phosphosulfolactate phosphatase